MSKDTRANWLLRRQNYLTATDAVELYPLTPTGKAKAQSTYDTTLWEVVGSKKKILTQVDIAEISYAAKRGHILERPALEEYADNTVKPVAWWDDRIIVDTHRGIGFSPDGTDCEVHDSWSTVVPIECVRPRVIYEVKCYGSGKHLHMININSNEHALWFPIRVQIAFAMYVCESIEEGIAILFNPDLADRLHTVTFTREQLLPMMEPFPGMVSDFTDRFASVEGPTNKTISHNTDYYFNRMETK